MSKTTAIGLIILFSAIIVAGVLYLVWKNSAVPPIVEEDQFPRTPSSPIGPQTPEQTQIPTADLLQLTKETATSFGVVKNGVRFIERITGHILETAATSTESRTISNLTIPYTFNALWSQDGTKALIWYREDEKVKIASVEFNGQTKGVLLPEETYSAVYAPDRNRIFYTIRAGEELVGIAANPDNTSQSEVLRIPFSDFTTSWPTPRELSFLLKPTGAADGFLYRYNIDTTSFDKILGNIAGLDVVWSKDGSKALYSSFNTQTQAPNLYVYDVRKGIATPLEVQTFAGKCAWADKNIVFCAAPNTVPKGVYPDDWFKGNITFNDFIVRINTPTKEKHTIKNLPAIDVDLIKLSADNTYLYLKNKKDGTLWSLALPQ